MKNMLQENTIKLSSSYAVASKARDYFQLMKFNLTFMVVSLAEIIIINTFMVNLNSFIRHLIIQPLVIGLRAERY